MSVRIALIGAGSRSFGPKMIRDILLSKPLCEMGVELVLMDIVAEHLPENEKIAHQVMEQLNRKIKIIATTRLEEALQRANFVITAFEVDRYHYWSQDFHIPRKYGFKQIYGENGGPGGIFHALRNMGPLLQIARTMERLCPEAWLLNFSNPEQKLCEAVARLSGIKAVGLCHGYFMARHQLGRILQMPEEQITGQACGINHFTFFQTLQNAKTGTDLYPLLREREQNTRWTTDWHELALGRVLFRLFGLWPSPGTNHYGEYIRWASDFMASEMHFYYDALEGEPWDTNNIPDFIYTIDRVPGDRPWQDQSSRSEVFGYHPPAQKEEKIRASNEAAVPMMEALLLNQPRELEAVNILNQGAIPNLPPDMIVEVPALCAGQGLTAVPMAPLPEPLAALMRTQASINRLLVEAYSENNKEKLLQTLLLDPTVDSYKNAIHMMNEMLELQKPLLPEFH